MKYINIFIINLKQYFVYRVNFILWRVRVMLNLLIIYFLWTAVFEGQSTLFGYSLDKMIAYILLISLTSNIALSSKTADIAGEIIRGDLINYLLRPLNFFTFQAVRDSADKFLNIVFTIIEIGFIIAVLKPAIFIPSALINYFWFFLFLFIGVGISFFINMMLSFIGFWSVEVWAPRFIFYIIVYLFSGSYFPLDILPQKIYQLLMITPFPYLYYLPTRVLLGLEFSQILLYILASLFWLFVSYKVCFKIWNKGLNSFSFYSK